MRITENSFTQSYLSNINNARERISKLQEQLSTGRRVLNPSDDPEAADRILRIKNSITKNDQYAANVSDGQTMMTATENALNKFGDLMLEAKDILTKARNGGPPEQLSTFADQLDQLITDGVQFGNTKFNGKYLFGGTQTTDPPFILASDRSTVTTNPNGITGQIQVLVDDGTTQAINIDGQQAFQGSAIFQTLIQIRDAMRAGQVPTNAQFDAVNADVDYVSAQGGKAGLMMNALDMNNAYLQDRSDQLSSLLSVDADTDFAAATISLNKEQTMLQAALSMGARLIPQTLMDFLK